MRTSLFLFLLPAFVVAQEHPFLGAYTVDEVDGGVRIQWTIVGGNTCDGQGVQRSLDGVHFADVHTIAGLCGHPSVDVQYTWLDAIPPELQRVYYRVRMGFEDYSSVKSVDITRLITTEQRVFPSPAKEHITLLLNVPSYSTMELQVFAADGSLVRTYNGIPAQRTEIDLLGLASGVYTYTALVDGRTFTGRFVKG